jgi:hypothetical protein
VDPVEFEAEPVFFRTRAVLISFMFCLSCNEARLCHRPTFALTTDGSKFVITDLETAVARISQGSAAQMQHSTERIAVDLGEWGFIHA